MDSPSQLERALEIFLEWESESPPRATTPDELLARHPDLEDYLRPLLDDEPGVASDSDAEGERTVGGDYRIRREIGRGGMGVVYDAWQRSLGRPVALKVLAPHLSHSKMTIARFQREATTVARLQHQGIITVHEFGEDGDTRYLAMELVGGAPLDRVLRALADRPRSELDGAAILDAVRAHVVVEVDERHKTATGDTSRDTWSWHGSYVDKVCGLALQLTSALQHAHDHGVMHRDVKPSNILVRPNGRVVLTDFGLARESNSPAITATGEFAGTPYYVSPEQVRAIPNEIDHRTDVFSLGATLYEMLTLERPFRGPTTHSITAKILEGEPRDPSRIVPSLPSDLSAIVLKALEKRPSDRYPTAEAFGADLLAFLERRPVSAKRRGGVERAIRWIRREPIKAGLIAVVVAAGGLGAYVANSSRATSAGYEAIEAERIDELLAHAATGMLARRDVSTTLDELFAIDPGNPFGVICRARALSATKGAEAALLALRTHRKPGRADAALDRLEAWLHLMAGEQDQALVDRLHEPAVDAIDAHVAGVTLRPNQHFHTGQSERLEAACNHFHDSILRSQQKHILTYIELAFILSRLDDEGEARRCADSLRALWPELAPARMAAGIALTWFDIDEAIDELQRSVEIDPGFGIGWRNLGIALGQKGDREAAVRAFEKAIEQDPEDASGYSLLSIQHLRLGRIEDAVEASHRSVELAPKTALFRAQYAAALERAGEVAEAQEQIDRAIEFAPRVESFHRSVLGLARVRGDVEAERREAFRWVRAHPGGPTAHRELADFLIEHGTAEDDQELALKAARRAVELCNGDNAFVWLTLAEAAMQHDELADEVKRALEEARFAMPDDPDERAAAIERLRALEARDPTASRPTGATATGR